MWISIALWVLVVVCLLMAAYGLVAAAVPTLRPMLRRGGQVRWPAFVCLMMACIFVGFALMTLTLWPEPGERVSVVWIYFAVSVVLIGFTMWRERIGKSST